MNHVTILAAMHGNETYGIDLHAEFMKKYPSLASYVQLIIGNEKAYSNNVRYIDTDMNRHYNSSIINHETTEIVRVEKLLTSFKPNYIIDIHTTKRDSGVFFISDEPTTDKQPVYGIVPVDVCVMRDPVIKNSFIGNHSNAVSIEYSLRSISEATTVTFIEGLAKLVSNRVSRIDTKIYDITKLITKDDLLKYPNLRNYDSTVEGVALMVPADKSEMDAEYYGFWCTNK